MATRLINGVSQFYTNPFCLDTLVITRFNGIEVPVVNGNRMSDV